MSKTFNEKYVKTFKKSNMSKNWLSNLLVRFFFVCYNDNRLQNEYNSGGFFMKAKKMMALMICTALTVSMTACGGKKQEKPADSKEDGIKIGLALNGGLGDKNFNDMGYEGMQRAAEELGVTFDYLEPETASDLLPNLRTLSETREYDLIIVLGISQSDAVNEIVMDFPEQKYSHIDSTVKAENVSSVSTKWQEQTFMAGVVAGMGTLSDMDKANEDNVIGVILGQENPDLRKGVIGYKAGAMYVNPDVKVLEGNVNNFSDPDKGKEMALSMYNQGADFIQSIAGMSGMGIYNASKEQNRYSFGVGANVNYVEPDYIVGTSARVVDEMVYNEVKAFVDGTWEAGVKISGLKEGSVGLDTEQSNVKIPDDIQKVVEDVQKMISDGTLVPPETEEELADWVANNQYQ